MRVVGPCGSSDSTVTLERRDSKDTGAARRNRACALRGVQGSERNCTTGRLRRPVPEPPVCGRGARRGRFHERRKLGNRHASGPKHRNSQMSCRLQPRFRFSAGAHVPDASNCCPHRQQKFAYGGCCCRQLVHSLNIVPSTRGLWCTPHLPQVYHRPARRAGTIPAKAYNRRRTPCTHRRDGRSPTGRIGFGLGDYFRFSGFRPVRSSGTNRPSLRINSSSNQISPPPQSAVWMQTMSQWTALRLPLSASSS